MTWICFRVSPKNKTKQQHHIGPQHFQHAHTSPLPPAYLELHSGAAVCFQVCAWTSCRAFRVGHLSGSQTKKREKTLPNRPAAPSPISWPTAERQGRTDKTGRPLPGLALSSEGCVQVHASSPVASRGQKGAWASIGTARPARLLRPWPRPHGVTLRWHST